MKIPSKYVWVERLIVLLVQVAAGVTATSTSSEHTTAGVLSIGGITLAQVVSAVVTHLKALEEALGDRNVKDVVHDVESDVHDLSTIWDSLSAGQQQAARDAGKAL